MSFDCIDVNELLKMYCLFTLIVICLNFVKYQTLVLIFHVGFVKKIVIQNIVPKVCLVMVKEKLLSAIQKMK